MILLITNRNEIFVAKHFRYVAKIIHYFREAVFAEHFSLVARRVALVN